MSEQAILCEVGRLSNSPRKHASFSFGPNGCFFDDHGFPIGLWGVVEMESFFRHLDAQFETPIGRKILYAATDAEELVLRHPSFAKPRFGGRKKWHRLLASRSSLMGWGQYEAGTIQSPCHDVLSVGFALAHEEHLARTRLDINWRQSQAEVIRFEVAQKSTPMQPVQVPMLPDWGQSTPDSLPAEDFELELEEREPGFFLGGQRSSFLPLPVLIFLSMHCRGDPVHHRLTPLGSEFLLKERTRSFFPHSHRQRNRCLRRVRFRCTCLRKTIGHPRLSNEYSTVAWAL